MLFSACNCQKSLYRGKLSNSKPASGNSGSCIWQGTCAGLPPPCVGLKTAMSPAASASSSSFLSQHPNSLKLPPLRPFLPSSTRKPHLHRSRHGTSALESQKTSIDHYSFDTVAERLEYRSTFPSASYWPKIRAEQKLTHLLCSPSSHPHLPPHGDDTASVPTFTTQPMEKIAAQRSAWLLPGCAAASQMGDASTRMPPRFGTDFGGGRTNMCLRSSDRTEGLRNVAAS